ncbi:MAG: COX15/CtaA family protein [Patescibacteria group bacterium]|nr:COX15/CtaA family protein [Patescibacteria group bacterium]
MNQNNEKRIGILLLIFCGLVFGLIVLGGFVRLTGSGLSIPEWPFINNSLLPPLSDAGWEAVYKTYHRSIEGIEVPDVFETPRPGIIPLGQFKIMFAIEYFHRFMAAASGLFFLVILIQVLRDKSIRRKIGKLMGIATFILLVQAILGGIVVKTDLKAQLVMIHLGIGFYFLSLLLWITLKLLSPGEEKSVSPMPLPVKIAWLSLLIIFLQVLSGGLMASAHAGLFMNTFPKMGVYWFPPVTVLWDSTLGPAWRNIFENRVLIQFVHRWWAFIGAGTIITLIMITLKSRITPLARLAIRTVGNLLILQMLIGIGTLLWSVPTFMGMIHQATGLLLFTFLVITTYELDVHYGKNAE